MSLNYIKNFYEGCVSMKQTGESHGMSLVCVLSNRLAWLWWACTSHVWRIICQSHCSKYSDFKSTNKKTQQKCSLCFTVIYILNCITIELNNSEIIKTLFLQMVSIRDIIWIHSCLNIPTIIYLMGQKLHFISQMSEKGDANSCNAGFVSELIILI